MAGIRLYGTSPSTDPALAPGQLPGERFSDYLAKIHSSWTRSAKRTASSFAAVTLNTAHTQDESISANLRDWLDSFSVGINPSKTKNTIVATLNLEGSSPVRVQPGFITHHKDDEELTAQTALAMATLAMADPKMRKKGVTLEGSEAEKLLLLHALEQIGFTGKIHNPPPKDTPEFEKAAEAIIACLPAFLEHVGKKSAPQPPSKPPAPKP